MYGNLATTTDARGKTTSFFYDDSTHALPTRVVVDPQNNTGTQTTLTTYDYSTGVVTSTTDANNNVSNIYYTNYLLNSIDPFGRPGLIKGPSVNGSRHNTKTFYNDAGRNVTVLSDLNAEGDGLLKSEVFSDELGRAIESRQYETASAFIAVRKTYDTPNRLSRTSNPFRAGETVVWTTTIMDVLGRVIEVKTPDNAVVSTAYDANFTTVTDQAGKVRRSMVDGLGRLIRVDEPNSSGSLGTTTSPNQPTSYDYDVLGNLRHVYQATQTRTFTYDALSRLRSADNPENGAPGIPDSGKISYNYDDNGNLSQKVDPRFLPNTQTHITTSYVYDALNRVTLRSYNDGTPAVTYTYDTLTQNGKGRLASVSSSVSAYSYSGYDATGRVLGGSQTIGSQTYAMSYGYDLAGHVSAMTYPSGRTVTNAYDTAGRLDSFTGTLGDGASRNYATGIKYSLFGGLSREQFGTNAAIYHTRQYNIRGQLYDVRASTLNDTGDWNRGAIVNYYSLVNYGFGLSGTDNNGNVHIQQTWIPNDDAISGSSFMQQNYAYDSLNRLTSVTEYQNGTTQTGSQTFGYDRWGNRTSSSASGTGISVKQFSVNPANNRLGVPSGQAGAMSYDNAGNLTTDTYSGSAVTRAYDAENRMTSELQANNYQAGTYSYDGDGRRIKRLVGGTETWQVYGLGGELLAEYAANAAPANPQKEYGYRNGELLITAEASAGGGTRQNVALAANGGVATAQNYTADLNGSHFRPADAIDGIRYAVTAPPPGDINDFWRDEHGLPSWVQIDFNGQKTIDQVDVITCRDYPNNALQSDPPATETFSQYGVTAFEVQYWTGTGWQTVPGGSITNNNLVWKQVNFTAVTTGKVRVLVNAAADNVARIMEVEVWGAAARQNVALTANGATATAQNYTADVNGSHYR
ncbi:MAG TPA: hypothetical protein VJT71_17555, partial [Pyrinomonadaceae bacterium]|nr:hypothetical protein [Pyrinomonadaceae bacterium]